MQKTLYNQNFFPLLQCQRTLKHNKILTKTNKPMKKILLPFLAVMALVSCKKENVGGGFDNSPKTVEITIENTAAVTKAETSMAGASSPVCSVTDLTALFADKDGNIIASMPFQNSTQNGKYVFKDVPAEVSKVAAIALRGNEVPATLTAAKTLAQNYEIVDAEYNGLVVYGADLAPVVEDKVLVATFEVAPLQARIEVEAIRSNDTFAGTPEYSAYDLKSLGLAGYSNYDADLSDYVLNMNRSTVAIGSNKAWTWNIKEQAVKNMVLSLDLVGNGYTVAVPARTVTVASYKVDGVAIDSFEAGNIYRFSIAFGKDNFDANDTEEVKVDVDLTIAKWTINTTEVDFAN